MNSILSKHYYFLFKKMEIEEIEKLSFNLACIIYFTLNNSNKKVFFIYKKIHSETNTLLCELIETNIKNFTNVV